MRYDPFDLSAAEVWQNGELKAIAKQLEIKEYNGRKRRRGNAIAQATRSGSRLLQSLEKDKKNERLNGKESSPTRK